MVKPIEILIVVVVAVVAYWLGSLNSSSNNTRTAAAGKRIDPATGIEFSDSESFHVSKNLALLGVGTRKKAILNVYSLGFFVSKQIQKQLVGQEGASICKTILESSAGPKAVQLTFSMGIGPEKIAEAISQLKTVDAQVLEEFKTMLIEGMGEGKMKKGESFTFEWKGSDAITATARGKFIGQVKDKALATGVLGLYVGPDSVSPSLRRDLGCI